MIPLVCTVEVGRRDGRRRRIWIPLFLLWPLIVALLAVAELVVILACLLLLLIRPRDAVKIALVLPAALNILLQGAGLRLEFAGPGRGDVLVELS